jgi:uncharacterized protein (TIGR03437 family)
VQSIRNCCVLLFLLLTGIPGQVITTVAGIGLGGYSGDGGQATSANLERPTSLAFDSAGNLYIADPGVGRVRKVDKSGIISTVYAGGSPLPAGTPMSLAVDGFDNLFVADGSAYLVYKITPAGVRTTFFDGRVIFPPPYSSNNNYRLPSAIAADTLGNVYVSLIGSSATIAGPSLAQIYKLAPDIPSPKPNTGWSIPVQDFVTNFDPRGMTIDSDGNLYISDSNFGRVRKVTPKGDNYSIAEKLHSPLGVAVAPSGEVYFSEPGNNSVQRISSPGAVTMFAGNGLAGFAGDGGAATLASLNGPSGLAVDPIGNLFIADQGNHRVRKVASPFAWPYLPGDGVVNAASFLRGPVSPGEVVTLFGQGFGPPELFGLQLTPDGRVASSLANTMVLFDGVPSPLIYATTNQVSAVVPYLVAGRAATQVAIQSSGLKTKIVTVPVSDTTPAIFTLTSTGKGQAAMLNGDGSINSPSNPAGKNSVVVLYATGAGQTNPPGIDGSLVGSAPPLPRLPVSASIGGIRAEVLYAGGAPGMVAGVLQINVKLPSDVPSGPDIPVIFSVGSGSSQIGVTMAIR